MKMETIFSLKRTIAISKKKKKSQQILPWNVDKVTSGSV